MKQQDNYSKLQLSGLVILRVSIGWHFLVEGLLKVLNPNWSSIGYLLDSKGALSSLFYNLANNATALGVADFMNQWGLVLIGLGIILGAFTKFSVYSGMLLLALYYLSHPPCIGFKYAMPTEGSYLLIDKVFIEFCALGVIALFPSGNQIGLDRFFVKKNF